MTQILTNESPAAQINELTNYHPNEGITVKILLLTVD